MSESEAFVESMENEGTVVADTEWTYAGYNMTVFRNNEELATQSWLGGGEMKFHPQDALELAGGLYSEASDLWIPNIVVDREPITGQDPASDVEVATIILEQLK